jgi:hypothetical protein
MSVDQVFHEFHTPEFHELRVFFDMPIEGHADLPGPGEDLGILERRLVRERLGAAGGDSLDDVELVAVEVSRAIEPAQVVKPLVSTTSVSPSQRPFDQPIQLSAGASVWFAM